MKRKCDRCGKKYKAVKKQLNHQNITYPYIQGVSERCVERIWEVCDKCLGEIIYFMDTPKIVIKIPNSNMINPTTYCIDCSVYICWKEKDGFRAWVSCSDHSEAFKCPRKKRCLTWEEVKEEKTRIKKKGVKK